ALAAPFPMFKVMPTGGISLKNLAEYISCPVIAACGGSYMVKAELIDGQNWAEVTRLCKESRKIIEEARAK
ncbi:MAG: keto-hydroxyglutarate-aldolase/keto-deoxy-phosphogluconate aldolase, partial [Treponema sp.]|nr:keto-hydroxyglutarate-aldolase/keto-deoxy-phosphogluconate aldolase [Treponema sp.]